MAQTRSPVVDGDNVFDGDEGPARRDELLGDQLISVLARERRRLETLLVRLESACELVAAGELGFLPWTAAEIEEAVDRAREGELVRALLVHRLAQDLDLPNEAVTLSAMAEVANEPYASILAGHRLALLDLLEKIECAGTAARGLAGRGLPDLEGVDPSLPSLVDFLR